MQNIICTAVKDSSDYRWSIYRFKFSLPNGDWMELVEESENVEAGFLFENSYDFKAEVLEKLFALYGSRDALAVAMEKAIQAISGVWWGGIPCSKMVSA